MSLSIVRISELDVCPVEIVTDENKHPWGLVEVDNKVYKFDLAEFLASYNNSPLFTALETRLATLEHQVADILEGLDENIALP